MHTESQTTVPSNEHLADYATIQLQLAQAKQEIEDLKLQLLWLERTYE